ncbi:DHS-like NAD/FAD-binding domain-containing protein [Hyphopichia burtonii NRRL Y-1933]|uniref:DHS-like NAD/FAD-binding domain-containing protein n=1 Tax=Hyphopichia burtonii NRRL Y-1933 TaxID=984485 RepID=A0A1E4RIL5_9ASCO|nr:DHS-like NAD/FAD-binding domain-containing protein [Hyphopichia burtonii NRRL Y-1933]ODV67071.1 DHS-like NAD/FAD-binding domain-containing protein [Hyphopichia burtonii NRRL Y-1933]
MKTIDLLESNRLGSKLPTEDSIKLNEVTKIVFKLKKTIVLTGAGISCNAGIPDFRSSDGLYNLVKSKYPKNCVKGQDLFDISLFRNELTLSLFCTFMEGLYSSSLKAKPTETHKFIKILKEKNKLLRCYTQNIDCLEKVINLNCGIDLNNFNDGNNSNFNKIWKNLDVVQLHGNLQKLSCTQCFKTFNWSPDNQAQLSKGLNPECENCYLKYQERLYSGKRLTGNIGMLRPDIVLYGENHPQSEIISKGLSLDMSLKSDLLIIMGTSLKVDGIKKLVRNLSKTIHDKGGLVIFINKTPISKSWSNLIDYEILSDCDDFIKVLKHEIPDLFLTQEQLDSKKLSNNKEKTKEESLLTPPSTPKKTKIKREPKKFKRAESNSKKINKATNSFKLPSPQSSFNEDDEPDLDELKMTSNRSRALRAFTRSQMNQERSIKVKRELEDVDINTKRIKL